MLEVRALAIVFIAALFGCRGEVVNQVRLDVDGTGFSCQEELPDGSREFLVARAYAGPAVTGELNIVVDYLSFAGLPSCRTAGFIEGCVESGCPTVHRSCVPMQAMDIQDRVDGPLTSESFFAAFLAHLADQPPATRDAPDGVVMVRVVGTTEPCADLARVDGALPRYRCEQLLGCGYSCPAQLDEIEGDVDISYDTLAFDCGVPEVEACAGLGLPGAELADPATWCQR